MAISMFDGCDYIAGHAFHTDTRKELNSFEGFHDEDRDVFYVAMYSDWKDGLKFIVATNSNNQCREFDSAREAAKYFSKVVKYLVTIPWQEPAWDSMDDEDCYKAVLDLCDAE